MTASGTYPIVPSSIQLGGQQHEENKKNWQPILERFSSALEVAASEGKESALIRHVTRGQLLGL